MPECSEINLSSFLDEDKALACVHCGLCLSSCPTFLETGDENLSPRGRIYLMRAIADGKLEIDEESVKSIDSCLGCRACETACPSGVQYGSLLEDTRDHIEATHKRSVVQTALRRIFIEKIFPHPWRLRLALIPAMIAKGLGLRAIMPQFAKDALDLVPDDLASGSTDEPLQPSEANGTVQMIRGCVMPVMFQGTNANTIRLANAAGYKVNQPAGQSCCGALHAHSGQLEEARRLARKNIDAFESTPSDIILINAAGCGSTLKEYGHLLKDDPEYADRAQVFSAKVKDLTEWLPEHLPNLKLETGKDYANGPIVYHDACHLAHPQGITKQPRDLVDSVAPGRRHDLHEAEVCCGSAGTYNLTQPELAEALQRRKIDNILKSGAHIVITSNPGCILQIKAGLKKANRSDIKVLHVADFLAAHL